MRRDFALAAKSIIMNENKMLLLHRSKKEMEQSKINKIDAWDLPGGGVQFFEPIEQGLIREITEETNLKVKIIKPVDVHDLIRPHLHITIVTYLCQFISGQVQLSEEHDSFKWLTIEELRKEPIPGWLLRNFEKAIN